MNITAPATRIRYIRIWFAQQQDGGESGWNPPAYIITDAVAVLLLMIDEVERLHQRHVLTGVQRFHRYFDRKTAKWSSTGYCATCKVTWPCRTAVTLGLAEINL